MMDYVGDPVVNITLIALIVFGGLGFYVWEDVYRSRDFRSMSLHTKLVLVITGLLLVGGTALFWMFEYNNPGTMGNLPPGQQFLAAAFQSATVRTAGFNSIDQGALSLPSKMLSMVLMFIGGSSGSTAGGIKTVTFGVLVLTAVCVMRGKNDVNAFGRRIPMRAILNALALTMTALLLLVIGVFTMVFFQEVPLMDVMFEAVSAFGTVGLSTGVTPMMHPVSQVILMFLMFFGRIGILSISLGLVMRGSGVAKIRYPEGKVLIG